MNILVLCTGNSCRSILAEVMINELGAGRVTAYSAGSTPTGRVNPGAIRKLASAGHATSGLRSKSWDEFSGESAPQLDIVITVCDSAAGESCPVWYGSPVRVHWGIPDPADAEPEAAEAAFDLAYDQLRERIEAMLELPMDSMDSRSLTDALKRIHDASVGREQAVG